MSRELVPKAVRIYDIILAFQAFGGKSMKCTDAADVLHLVDLSVIEVSLQKMAKEVRKIGKDQNYPDLLKLADDIEKRVGAYPRS